MQEMQTENKPDQDQIKDQKYSILSQILTPQARERLARIRIVKETKAQGVEELIIRMAKSGILCWLNFRYLVLFNYHRYSIL